MLISQQDLHTAAERIHTYLSPTPVIRSAYYSEKTGAEVYLKLETVQPTHSFKVRGALNALLALSPEQRARGVVTASQGNHGLGVTFAAAKLSTQVTVYLPQQAPKSRVELLHQLGAEVVLYGGSWDEANAHAIEVAAGDGKAYIHPFNDRQVMAGQGTIFTELGEQIPAIDLVVASIGGGGLLSGLISAGHYYSPQTRFAGVETIGADCMYRSRQAGAIIELPAITSVATSLGAKRTEPEQYEIITAHASDLVVVPDEAAIQQVIETLREEKLLIEPAASCTLAALISGQIQYKPQEKIVIVLCGANVSLESLQSWLT